MVDGSKLFLNLELTVLGLTYLFLDSTSEMRALPGWVFDAISHLLEAMPSAESFHGYYPRCTRPCPPLLPPPLFLSLRVTKLSSNVTSQYALYCIRIEVKQSGDVPRFRKLLRK